MLKLIIGVKGTGKTKALINMVNTAVENSQGNVVCIEKGDKLTYDVKHQARLIDTKQYFISDAQSLYGFIAGILASKKSYRTFLKHILLPKQALSFLANSLKPPTVS